MKLDVGITQGPYWKGAQIPYWLYMIFVIVPFTGLFGIDHLLLRSPMTAMLKTLSIIPLFGFWYFYDMAQLGEKELIMKHGIGVPFYGPVGIGAGMFTGEKGQPVSPPDTPRPWRFIAYVITTCLFISFPINKLIIGDYWAALSQILMYLIFPLTFAAIAWGFYDMYRIVFDTRGVFDKGTARVFPASWINGSFFDNSVMGPGKAQDDVGLAKLIKKAYSTSVELADASLSLGSVVARTQKSAADVGPVIVDSFGRSVASLAPVVAKEAEKVMDIVPRVADKVANVGIKLAEQVPRVTEPAVDASAKMTSLLGKLPDIADKITGKLSDPQALLAAAQQQKGGSLSGIVYSGLSGIEGAAGTVRNTADMVHGVEEKFMKTNLPGGVNSVVGYVGRTAATTASGAVQRLEGPLEQGINAVKNAIPNAQTGGMNPSNTTVVVLFSVALLAFGGYTAYTLRNTFNTRKEENDDTPPESAPVRGSSKA